MTAVYEDLEIEQGTSWSAGFAPILPDTFTPFDNTWTVRAQVRPSIPSDTVLHEWSIAEDNVEITDGVIKLSVAPAESSTWTWTNGVYDLEISKDGYVIRLLQGKIKVRPEVTR